MLSPSPALPSSAFGSWGRLFRLSLAPSAAADIAAGVVVAARAWPGGYEPYVLMLASLCVYHGGMALNDWADRDVDARARPERPIPSGAIDARRALAVGFALLLAGPLCASFVGFASAAALACVALAAALYDLAGRGPWRGPLLLAVCRAGNIGTGILYGISTRAAGELRTDVREYAAPAAIALAYALYVFFVSRLGRREDVGDETALGRAPAVELGAAALALAALPLIAIARLASDALVTRTEAGLVVAGTAFVVCWGAAPLALRAWTTRTWRKADVLRAMGFALRRLLVFTAGAALLCGGAQGWIVALAILCGYPIAYALRSVFPPS
jgi:4-hydroxybenzoate polyprenyltransferase